MRKATWLLFLAVSIITNTSNAQKKAFTEADLLANKTPKNFYNTLPVVVKWIDDEHVILNQKIHPDSTAKNYVLDVKTGNLTLSTSTAMPAGRGFGRGGDNSVSSTGKSVYTKDNDLFLRKNGEEKRLTNDKAEEKNATFSPDSNYIGYTKNNNLYTYNFAAGKETQLTTDGSFTSLNGFASWVYYEEIFGRPTRYRAFWWSPDSKKLAYMHFNESMVPMFPIYNSDGQHGSLEETRYPKAGDKNPETKVGFVNPDGGATVWAAFNEKDDQYFGWP
ncbi:MAG: DPP IV N-terminal domain-containing protein, partial [Pedobacter sp.]|nr:DPP IV N-terminal domain-containing protein [Chitinophagaceae bacterium]